MLSSRQMLKPVFCLYGPYFGHPVFYFFGPLDLVYGPSLISNQPPTLDAMSQMTLTISLYCSYEPFSFLQTLSLCPSPKHL